MLAVGWSVLPPRQRLTPDDPIPVSAGETALNGWVKVSSDNRITIVMCKTEAGQGIHTTLAMLLADEMDAAWDQVRWGQSTLDKIYNNQAALLDALPFQPEDNGVEKRLSRWMIPKVIREVPGALGTGGSSSIKDLWLPMREAGASARAALVAAAADRWKVSASECRTESGKVIHSSGKWTTCGELAARAAELGIPRNVVGAHECAAPGGVTAAESRGATAPMPSADRRPSRAVSRNGNSGVPAIFGARPDRFDHEVEFRGGVDLARHAVGHPTRLLERARRYSPPHD